MPLKDQLPALTYHPLTAERWADLEALFGQERGADSGCWCMWWRLTRKDWEAMGKAGRKAAFRGLVEAGAVPGLLAYDGGRAVGWCAVAPRRDTPGLDRSPVAKPVDHEAVWSITCFYVDTAYRRAGMLEQLVEAAARHAARNGARLLEAYPHDRGERTGAGDVFTGLAAVFRRAGFEEVARRKPRRPVMRRRLD